jgi:hypothetical protein
MENPGRDRIALRRATHSVNQSLISLADELDGMDDAAAQAVRQARLSLFEAWTILCVPPSDEDDDHDH